MVDVSAAPVAGTAEVPSDFGEGDEGLYAYWMTQEKIAEKEEGQWPKRNRLINKRYRDERPDANSMGRDLKKFNVLWSNVETLLPVLYARTPKADVQRRYKDQDPVGRLASILLERSLNYSIDTFDFDGVMKPCVKDRLLGGRGVARIIYVPHFGEEIPTGDESEEAGEDGSPASATVASEGDAGQDEPEKLREVDFEEVKISYIFWGDYREGPARVWAEVPWVRYRSYLTRDELVNRFGKKKGKAVTLDYTPKGDENRREDAATADAYKKAVVHEYWDKRKLQVVWLAPGTPGMILDEKDDPLKLNGFFPNPDPLLATTTTDKRIPVPDYAMYQDQAQLIDDMTQRIAKLIRALRAKGIYAADEKDSLQRLFDIEDDAVLVPVENWAHLAAKGGLDKAIEWVPIQQISETLIQLYEARDKEIQVIYQITGISDILRGETSPVETMGAQQLKSNFATRRIMPKQKDVAMFARGLIRLMADVISTHFSPKTISMITGYPQLQPVPAMPPMPQQQLMLPPPAVSPTPQAGVPGGGVGQSTPPAAPSNVVPHPAMMQQPPAPPPPSPEMVAYQQQMQQVQAVVQQNQVLQKQFDDAVALMKRDAVHDFRIDIEADSTIAADEMAEKAARTEFLQQMVPLLEQVIPIAQGNPALADLSKEIVLFAARAFPAARSLEEALETAFDKLKGMPPNPNAGGKGKGAAAPDPHVEMAKVQQQGQADQASTQQKAQADQQANAIKAQQVQGQLAISAQSEQARQQYDQGRLAIAQQKLVGEQQFRSMEMEHMAATDGRDLT